VAARDVRREWGAVDQDAHCDDQVLVDRLLAVIEARRVLADQEEVVARGNLCDDPAAERLLGVALALAPPPVRLQRRRQTCRHDEQHERDDGGDRVTHRSTRTKHAKLAKKKILCSLRGRCVHRSLT